MPYTLAKFFIWGLLMAFAGGIVGWLLRSLKARTNGTAAQRSTIDESEVDRLRGRLANLEPVVAERDRLRMELADVRGSSAGALGFSSTPEISIIPDAHADAADVPSRAERDVAAAAAVIGKKITLDDLTVVEGIGPKIAELCGGIGITTWQQLADADVADLQSMLDAAGSRFQVHRPASWPQQASLLTSGKWDDFADFTASLARGK